MRTDDPLAHGQGFHRGCGHHITRARVDKHLHTLIWIRHLLYSSSLLAISDAVPGLAYPNSNHSDAVA